MSALGGDAGISHNTARAWLSVLETSYIIHRLPAWHINIRKQVVKTPKLHFFDSGLVCRLLGIREPDHLRFHPLRGSIFETWVISEIYKNRVHRGMQPNLFHYRESRGLEIDLLIEQGQFMNAVEIKSGATISRDFFKNLERLQGRLKETRKPYQITSHLVYGGEKSRKQSSVQVLSWDDVHKI